MQQPIDFPYLKMRLRRPLKHDVLEQGIVDSSPRVSIRKSVVPQDGMGRPRFF